MGWINIHVINQNGPHCSMVAAEWSLLEGHSWMLVPILNAGGISFPLKLNLGSTWVNLGDAKAEYQGQG